MRTDGWTLPIHKSFFRKKKYKQEIKHDKTIFGNDKKYNEKIIFYLLNTINSYIKITEEGE